jgi:hypothetical protein
MDDVCLRRAVRVGLVAVSSVLFSPAAARAQSLTADEKAFVDSHVGQFVKVEPTKVVDPALPSVFAVPFYKLTVTVLANGASSIQEFVVARLGSDLVGIAYPSEDDSAPQLGKLLNPAFRLRGDQDGAALQRALDATYPPASDEEKKTAVFHHTGSQWQFVRNHFFGGAVGFIFTTDRNGAITSVRYTLKLP